jgi:hypothetical protein
VSLVDGHSSLTLAVTSKMDFLLDEKAHTPDRMYERSVERQ